MKKILFVDDEPNILKGLRRMLHSMRTEWNMEFADSGQKALDLLSKSDFDVVVTDMRMPAMNGLELLTKIEELYPRVIRIVLSGQSSNEIIIQSVGPIHQYLSKPTSPDKLKFILSRTCSIHELLEDEKLIKLISRMESLPSLPSNFNKLMNELKSENSSLKSVGKIISKDICMSAKVLQLVNSAFFGVRDHVSSPEQAVSLLGLEIVSGVALTSHVFRQFDEISLLGISIDTLWDHCLNVSIFAKHICEKEIKETKKIDYAFIAGMLHDIGILIFATNIKKQYSTVISNVSKNKTCLVSEEINVFGVSHENIGAYLMGLWGFNDYVIEALAFHHNPAQSGSEKFSPLTAVYLADRIEHELFPERAIGFLPEIDKEYIEKLNLTDKIPIWREECKKLLDFGV